MKSKFKYGESENTAWFVSNCNNTSGATKRFEFAKKLISAGLKERIQIIFYNIFYQNCDF